MIALTVKYILFATAATAVNIGTQYASLRVYDGPLGLYLAMAMGTGTGLLVKYILDKNFIFYHRTETTGEDFRKFILYSFMGVITTLIFWGTELLFHHLFPFESAKFIGALVGLSIGYLIKYNLDKKFVFV